jgi:hypothetical protein
VRKRANVVSRPPITVKKRTIDCRRKLQGRQIEKRGLRSYKRIRKNLSRPTSPAASPLDHIIRQVVLPVDTFSWLDADSKKYRPLQKRDLLSRDALKIHLFYGEDAASK